MDAGATGPHVMGAFQSVEETMNERIDEREPEARDYAARAYYYRRPLSPRASLPAIAAGVGVGLAAFYVVRLLLQRTPLERPRGVPVLGPRGSLVRRRSRG